MQCEGSISIRESFKIIEFTLTGKRSEIHAYCGWLFKLTLHIELPYCGYLVRQLHTDVVKGWWF